MRTEQEVSALLQELENDPGLQTLHSEQEEALAFYNLDYTISHSKDATPIKPGTARAKVENAVNNLITDNPVVTCDKPKENQKSQRQADRSENFGQRFLYHLDRESIEPPIRDLAKDGINFGMFVKFGPIYLPESIPDKPTRGKGQKKVAYELELETWEGQKEDIFPYLVRVVSPLNFFFPSGQGQPEYGAEIGEITVGEIKRLLRSLGTEWSGEGGKDEEKVKWAQFASRGEIAYRVDGEVVHLKANPYPFCPYHIGSAGFGSNDPSGSAANRYKGLLYGSRTSLIGEAEIMTAILAKIKLEAYGKWWMRESDRPKGPIALLGGITEFPDGSAGPQPWPDSKVSEDDYRVLSLLKGQIDSETYSQALAGVFPAIQQPGYGRAIEIGQAKTKFQPLLIQLQKAVGTILRQAVWIHRNIIKEPIFEEGFKPEELLGSPTFHVKLEASDPQENYNRIEQGIKLRAARLITIREFKEKFEQNPDATKALQELMQEEAELSQQALVNQYTAEVYGAKVAEEAMKAKLAASQGVAPQPVPGKGGPLPTMPAQPGSAEEMDLTNRQMNQGGLPISQSPGGV